ncbi:MULTISPECIES: excalibur calcium-binding domain-containing protein [unclassified Lysobacter]|uniref:excalibur calcium-binding domain-containing protein n=1 Tax=unclassified Lysobacter TaxID=2635362 RepID=UPI001BEA8F58|nr:MULTISPECIES: excalibur calcium-binding domain-containing protein [unclassified Lysobacter]
MTSRYRAALTWALLCATADVGAHGGGLNAEGCHHDRKRGGYHCHRGAVAPVYPAAPTRPRRPAQAQGYAPSGGASYAAPAIYYPNCSAARAAGATPLRLGDPGYAPHLDRDRDGKACE